MTSPRAWPTMTVLESGKVLVTGGFEEIGRDFSWARTTESAEVYDPADGSWTPTGSMSVSRVYHGAVRLWSGKVLVAGGASTPGVGALANTSAELFDPDQGTFTATGSMHTPRMGPLVLLRDGTVLAFGGFDDPDLDVDYAAASTSAERYDPETGVWTPTGNMVTGRAGAFATAVRLASGDVLVVGGTTAWNAAGVAGVTACAEIYSPASGTWKATQALGYPVWQAAMAALPSGEALLVGGQLTVNVGPNSRVRLYDPGSGTWRATPSTSWSRISAAALPLPSGKVLVVGGTAWPASGGPFGELFDPATETWSSTSLLLHNHGNGPRAGLLPTGEVLIVGGGLRRDGIRPLVANEALSPTLSLWHVTPIAEELHAPR